MHVCGHWYGEQCCMRKFSFLSHGKALFHFPSAKNGSFCEVTTKMPFQNATVPFPKILDHLTWTISQPGHLKPFRPSRVKRTNVCRIGRKWVRFVLQAHDLSPMIF